MVELKIYLTNDLNERFRKIAMNTFGYGRGSLSKAAEEALTRWCSEHAEPSKQTGPAKTEAGQTETSSIRIDPDERQSSSQEPSTPR